MTDLSSPNAAVEAEAERLLNRSMWGIKHDLRLDACASEMLSWFCDEDSSQSKKKQTALVKAIRACSTVKGITSSPVFAKTNFPGRSDFFAALGQFPNLRRVDFGNVLQRSDCVDMCNLLQHATQLEHVSVTFISVSDGSRFDAVHQLCQAIASKSTLRSVRIVFQYCVHYHWLSSMLVSHLNAMEFLEEVMISTVSRGRSATGDLCTVLTSMFEAKMLTIANINSCRFTPNELTAMAHGIQHCQSLRELTLDSCILQPSSVIENAVSDANIGNPAAHSNRNAHFDLLAECIFLNHWGLQCVYLLNMEDHEDLFMIAIRECLQSYSENIAEGCIIADDNNQNDNDDTELAKDGIQNSTEDTSSSALSMITVLYMANESQTKLEHILIACKYLPALEVLDIELTNWNPECAMTLNTWMALQHIFTHTESLNYFSMCDTNAHEVATEQRDFLVAGLSANNTLEGLCLDCEFRDCPHSDQIVTAALSIPTLQRVNLNSFEIGLQHYVSWFHMMANNRNLSSFNCRTICWQQQVSGNNAGGTNERDEVRDTDNDILVAGTTSSTHHKTRSVEPIPIEDLLVLALSRNYHLTNVEIGMHSHPTIMERFEPILDLNMAGRCYMLDSDDNEDDSDSMTHSSRSSQKKANRCKHLEWIKVLSRVASRLDSIYFHLREYPEMIIAGVE